MVDLTLRCSFRSAAIHKSNSISLKRHSDYPSSETKIEGFWAAPG
jgi:hypothetical protein